MERKLKDLAHRHIVNGRLGQALDVLRQLICVNGKDAAIRLKHAEVCMRLNLTEQAVASYRVAAHLMADAGRVAQAKAALHQAIALAPNDFSLRRAIRNLIPTPVEAEEPVTEPITLVS